MLARSLESAWLYPRPGGVDQPLALRQVVGGQFGFLGAGSQQGDARLPQSGDALHEFQLPRGALTIPAHQCVNLIDDQDHPLRHAGRNVINSTALSSVHPNIKDMFEMTVNPAS